MATARGNTNSIYLGLAAALPQALPGRRRGSPPYAAEFGPDASGLVLFADWEQSKEPALSAPFEVSSLRALLVRFSCGRQGAAALTSLPGGTWKLRLSPSGPLGGRVVLRASRMARLPLSGEAIAPASSHCWRGLLPRLLGEAALSGHQKAPITLTGSDARGRARRSPPSLLRTCSAGGGSSVPARHLSRGHERGRTPRTGQSRREHQWV